MQLGRKILSLAAISCGLAWSQTPLTTIQDTLFKADGTRFSGTLTIRWSTFDSTSLGTIVQQSRSVPVVNGNLFVQLAPNAGQTAPANIYSVLYQSDGREQFSETWTVPASQQPLRVSGVRTATYLLAAAPGGAGNQTPVLESSVVGLLADLASRPRKGVAFGTNRVAIIDDSGTLESAVGSVGDCVLVDGTAGPCGGSPSFADAETPGGIVDGTNATLTLVNAPAGSSLMLFRNGLYMTPNFDYVLTGSSIVFKPGSVPQPGDTLTASYRLDSASAAAASPLAAGALTSSTTAFAAAAAQVICSAPGLSSISATRVSLGACFIPASALNPGDRIEVRFSVAHAGTASGFDFEVKWGNTSILARHGSRSDAALVGGAEAAITVGGAQLSVESWGTVLTRLPAILNAPAQSGVRVDLLGKLSAAGTDAITLTNITVLRYPGTKSTDAQ